MAAPVPAPRILLLLLLLLLPPPPGACHQVCGIFHGDGVSHESCPDFCCGTCRQQYCCSDVLKKFQGSLESCVLTGDSADPEIEQEVKQLKRLGTSFDMDSDPMAGFGASVAIGLTIFVLFIVTIIVCFTCSCCSLYKMCRRPRPIVTTTTATTVVHAPYPQPANMPPSYPGPVYQGYQPMPPQPGLPGAPYPTQYPPPYPAQPMGPPTYHETLAGAAMPYPASQPPYNPAYMDPPKLTH